MWPHKLWMRLFQARRSLRRHRLATKLAEAAWLKERERLVDRYEEELALERARFSSMQLQWSSRFVQLAGQQAMLVTDLEQEVTNPKFRKRPDAGKPEEVLSTEAYEEFLNNKELFWQEGIAEGRSAAEIKERWEEVKDSVIEDSINSVNTG